MTGSDTATVVFNGRRADCIPYEVAYASPTAHVDNLRTADTCPSEIAAFAKSNAMSLQNTVEKWTDQTGDAVDVPMRAPYVVPLNIFIMSGDLVSRNAAVRQNEATADVSRTSELYDNGQCGIAFSIGVIEDATRGNFTFDLLTADCTDNDVGRFKAVDAAKTALKGVNVFYFDGEFGVQGRTCRDGNSAVILISKWSGNETLAHELGHALSLDHTNWVPGMPLDDLMMSPASFPATLTTGQCFRTNVNTNSVLNSLPIRTEPTRWCPDSWSGPDCPSLTVHK
jgi:hypothetical protein